MTWGLGWGKGDRAGTHTHFPGLTLRCAGCCCGPSACPDSSQPVCLLSPDAEINTPRESIVSCFLRHSSAIPEGAKQGIPEAEGLGRIQKGSSQSWPGPQPLTTANASGLCKEGVGDHLWPESHFHICTHTYTYAHVRTYICTYSHTCTSTHINTHTLELWQSERLISRLRNGNLLSGPSTGSGS